MVNMYRIIEEWLPIIIDNVRPYYTISTQGRVFSTAFNKFLIPHENDHGYLQVSLMTNDGNRIFRKVHRLIMMTFKYFSGCEKYQVNHKNTDIHDNWIGNLEWVTAAENTNYSISIGHRSSVGENNPNATITEQDALRISKMLLDGYTDDQISLQIGCSKNIIRLIASGETWKHLFNTDTLERMIKTRVGHVLNDIQKHNICQFYQSHIHEYTMFKRAKCITTDALTACGIDINHTTMNIARRLLYKYQNPEITSQYSY